jgi:ferredoxin
MLSGRFGGHVARFGRAFISLACLAGLAQAALGQEVLVPEPLPAGSESQAMVYEEGGLGMGSLSSHFGCASCGGCGPYCPYSKPQPTLGEKRAAIASEFLDWARPQSIIRLHFDAAFDLQHPDRATFFWSKQAITSRAANNQPREENVDIRDFSFYMETASSKKASAFVELPLRQVNPDMGSNYDGMGDMNIGTKLVFCDKCDFLATFQFKTYFPTGASEHGAGNGHTTLEPGFLTTWNFCPKTYLQNEVALWIPIGGDKELEGQVLKIGASLNYLLWENDCCHKALIPTLEIVSWIPLSGEFFSIVDNANHSGDNVAIVNMGAGLRYVMSEHCEWGIGANFNISHEQWYDAFYQVEFRWFF